MYRFNSGKRYNVEIESNASKRILKNVRLISVEPGLVVLIDENKKEHIYTGTIGIYIQES